MLYELFMRIESLMLSLDTMFLEDSSFSDRMVGPTGLEPVTIPL